MITYPGLVSMRLRLMRLMDVVRRLVMRRLSVLS